MRKRHIEKNKVLLVNITRLGDMIQATPTIAGLKMENPECYIAVLVEKAFSEVCSHIPYVDEVIPIDLGLMVQALAREGEGIIDAYEYFDGIVHRLREAQFDFCLNMSNSAYTALLIHLIGITRMGGWVADSEGYRRIESDWARLFASNVFFRNRHFNSLNLVDIFRASADVEQHPDSLIIGLDEDALKYSQELLSESGLSGKKPLIAIQVGASQGKRQWASRHFARMAIQFRNELDAGLIFTGTRSELPLIEQVLTECNFCDGDKVLVAAGKTNVPQLGALLSYCDLLVTGDTGTMHMAVAVKVPVVALFLASAYCFETGPYSADNIVIQPTIECGPCNPNKLCARPDCHDHVSPELVVELVRRRLANDWSLLPDDLYDWQRAIVYRSCFDEYGFLDFVPMHSVDVRPETIMQEVYRRLWMDEIGGQIYRQRDFKVNRDKGSLNIIEGDFDIEILSNKVIEVARRGQLLIDNLHLAVADAKVPVETLSIINQELSEADKFIEEYGLTNHILGPLARMFVFARENLAGSDVTELAKQMKTIYVDLERRASKLTKYYSEVCSYGNAQR
jgi:ADP-heptose:LPS heptosyltransferase